MNGRSCTIVLIGENTAGRKWINYEIKKTWESGKGLLGIYIHNLVNLQGEKCKKGSNPFAEFTLGEKKEPFINYVKTYDPPYLESKDVYTYIEKNIESWIEQAIKDRE